MTPPRLARWLVRLAAGEDRTFVLSDLEEELARQAGGRGDRAARRWYWRQTVTSLVPLALLRVRTVPRAARVPLLTADDWCVGPTFDAVLGIVPAAGRAFGEGDFKPGSGHVVMLTHRFGQRVFGGDPAAIGQSLRLDDRPFEIVGVLPDVDAVAQRAREYGVSCDRA